MLKYNAINYETKGCIVQSLKNIFYVSLILSIMTLSGYGATRGDVNVIEASENIRYLSQKIVKDYLYYYKNPKNADMKVEITRSLEALNEHFREIAITTKDSDSKNILDYLSYSKNDIEKIIDSKTSSENVLLMLDYSETLLEGADSIENSHKYDFSKEEQMLMSTKNMEYLLERISKYYLSLQMGLNVVISKEQIKIAIDNFETSMQQINFYAYPHEIEMIRTSVNALWKTNKVFILKEKTLFIPNLLNQSMVYLEDAIGQIALYHSKNQ